MKRPHYLLIQKCLLTALFCGILLNLKAQHIEFSHLTWTEILAKSKQEKKPIFLDAYATWCGPCKQMSRQTFTDSEVGKFFNQNFIAVKMDMEKGEGIALAEQYKIQAYPTLLFLDENGKVLHRVCGFRNAQKFLEDGKNALDTEKRFAFYADKFENGEREAEFLKSFLQIAIQSCSDPIPVVDAYWKTQKPENYTDEFNWAMYLNFVKDIQSEQFTYLIQNLEEFKKVYGDDPDSYISGTYKNTLKELATNYLRVASTDKTKAEEIYDKYKNTKQIILNQKHSKAQIVVYEFDLVFFDRLGWYEEYAKTAISYVNFGISEDLKADKLNQLAWKFYENVDDSKYLGQAIEWAKMSIEIVEAYANLDTYAALLFKTGDIQKGKEIAEKAIEKAKENNQDYSETENLMKKYLEDIE